MQCPQCRSKEVSRSRSGNARLAAPLRLLIVYWRCRRCFCRFGARGPLLGGRWRSFVLASPGNEAA